MALGPSLLFDKSSLESLNLDEAVMLDNFYRSTITPLFFVECLADLEKHIRSTSTPEQLVGSLANRTPDMQGVPNVHHLQILSAELMREFDFTKVMGRVVLAGGQPVQLGDRTGIIYQESDEAKAFQRWSNRQFLEVERDIAKRWRRGLTAIDFKAMVTRVSDEIGPWRTPKTLADAKEIADAILDYLEPEFLLLFGLDLLGLPEAKTQVIKEWKNSRKPNLRQYVPYFVFLLTINLFFCLVLPTQLLRNVKSSHQVDLAYLYYLPFCSVFTSNDNFHVQTAPLFLGPMQDFVKGDDFKADMKRLVEHYSALPPEVLRTGLSNFASHPPEDESFITTLMWNKYRPTWRSLRDAPRKPKDPEEDRLLIERLKQMSHSPDLQPAEYRDGDSVDYVAMQGIVSPQKGKWLRFSQEQIDGMRERGELT